MNDQMRHHVSLTRSHDVLIAGVLLLLTLLSWAFSYWAYETWVLTQSPNLGVLEQPRPNHVVSMVEGLIVLSKYTLCLVLGLLIRSRINAPRLRRWWLWLVISAVLLWWLWDGVTLVAENARSVVW